MILEKKLSDSDLTKEGIKNALQPFCDKYLSGRSMWSRGWLEGARNRFARQVTAVFGPEWKMEHGYYDADYTLTKEGWKIKIVLQDGEIDRPRTYGGGREGPPRAHFEVYVDIEESPALTKDREEKAAKKAADLEEFIKNNQPDSKDVQRVQDVLSKFKDRWQALRHLTAMAGTIKSKSKAYRRGVAAYQALKDNELFTDRDAEAILGDFRKAGDNAVNEAFYNYFPHKKTLAESLKDLH